MTRISFSSVNYQSAESVAIITGVARSGKTTVGNILGSCRNVDHVEEPKPFIHLPILAHAGSMPESLALAMFQAYVFDLWHERTLMRNVNFRPSDQSSIWKQKSPNEIISRLIRMKSREDVEQYYYKKHPELVLTLTHLIPFCDFFWKALPGCRIIHVLRDCLQVAMDVTNKGWLSDEQLMNPIHASPYRKYMRQNDGVVFCLPYWVETGHEEYYLAMTTFSRGLHYWRRLLEMADNITKDSNNDRLLHLIKFSDVLDRPRDTINKLTETLGYRHTSLTKRLISKVNRSKEVQISNNIWTDVDERELNAARNICCEFNLDTTSIDIALDKLC